MNELLQFEWREEQHDDKLLHSLLECIKAISTSAVGCAAIRSAFPEPFSRLITLVYSDKKPGEVASRHLIVELIQLLFDIFPTASLPSFNEQERRRELWDDQDTLAASTHSNLVTLPHPHKSAFTLIRSLLLTPAPRAAEAPEVPVTPHEFIGNLHKPRIYKTYLQELSDICRDYFWVFCHPNNTIWNLAECDEGKVERPRAPGGMTGGVEAEAMRYMVSDPLSFPAFDLRLMYADIVVPLRLFISNSLTSCLLWQPNSTCQENMRALRTTFIRISSYRVSSASSW